MESIQSDHKSGATSAVRPPQDAKQQRLLDRIAGMMMSRPQRAAAFAKQNAKDKEATEARVAAEKEQAIAQAAAKSKKKAMARARAKAKRAATAKNASDKKAKKTANTVLSTKTQLLETAVNKATGGADVVSKGVAPAGVGRVEGAAGVAGAEAETAPKPKRKRKAKAKVTKKAQKPKVAVVKRKRGSDYRVGDGIKAEKAKRLKKKKQQIDTTIRAAIDVMESISQRPQRMRTGGIFENLRMSFFRAAKLLDQMGYDKTLDEITGENVDAKLTSGFVTAVSNGIETKDDVVVLIVGCERTNKLRSRFVPGGQWQQLIRLVVTDQENIRQVVALVSTQVLHMERIFHAGNVIRITDYQCVVYDQGLNDEGVSMCAVGIIILGAAYVRRQAFDNGIRAVCDLTSFQDYKATVETRLGASSADVDVAGDSTPSGTPSDHIDVTCALEGMSADTNVTQVDPGGSGPAHAGSTTAEDEFCDGRLCSIEGYVFPVCMTKITKFPDLEDIRSECFFADDKVADMSNASKRCMMYWWTAVNVYAITGKSNRMKLPECVLKYVRSLYPENDPSEYTGFRPVQDDPHATESEDEDE